MPRKTFIRALMTASITCTSVLAVLIILPFVPARVLSMFAWTLLVMPPLYIYSLPIGGVSFAALGLAASQTLTQRFAGVIAILVTSGLAALVHLLRCLAYALGEGL